VTEAFFTTKPEGKGTGLGLAICRRILQEHQGTIGYMSAPGRGTTVRLALPLANHTNGSAARRRRARRLRHSPAHAGGREAE